MPPRRRGGAAAHAPSAGAAAAPLDQDPAALRLWLAAWLAGPQDAAQFWRRMARASDAELAVGLAFVGVCYTTRPATLLLRDHNAFLAACAPQRSALMPRVLALAAAAPVEADGLQWMGCTMTLTHMVIQMAQLGRPSHAEAQLQAAALGTLMHGAHVPHSENCVAMLRCVLALARSNAVPPLINLRQASAFAHAATLAHPLHVDVIRAALPLLVATAAARAGNAAGDVAARAELSALALRVLRGHVFHTQTVCAAAELLLLFEGPCGEGKRCDATAMALEHALCIQLRFTTGEPTPRLAALLAAAGARARACAGCRVRMFKLDVPTLVQAWAVRGTGEPARAAAVALFGFSIAPPPGQDAYGFDAATLAVMERPLTWTSAQGVPLFGDALKLLQCVVRVPSERMTGDEPTDAMCTAAMYTAPDALVCVVGAPRASALPASAVLLRRAPLQGLAPYAMPRDMLPADALPRGAKSWVQLVMLRDAAERGAATCDDADAVIEMQLHDKCMPNSDAAAPVLVVQMLHASVAVWMAAGAGAVVRVCFGTPRTLAARGLLALTHVLEAYIGSPLLARTASAALLAAAEHIERRSSSSERAELARLISPHALATALLARGHWCDTAAKLVTLLHFCVRHDPSSRDWMLHTGVLRALLKVAADRAIDANGPDEALRTVCAAALPTLLGALVAVLWPAAGAPPDSSDDWGSACDAADAAPFTLQAYARIIFALANHAPLLAMSAVEVAARTGCADTARLACMLLRLLLRTDAECAAFPLINAPVHGAAARLERAARLLPPSVEPQQRACLVAMAARLRSRSTVLGDGPPPERVGIAAVTAAAVTAAAVAAQAQARADAAAASLLAEEERDAAAAAAKRAKKERKKAAAAAAAAAAADAQAAAAAAAADAQAAPQQAADAQAAPQEAAAAAADVQPAGAEEEPALAHGELAAPALAPPPAVAAAAPAAVPVPAALAAPGAGGGAAMDRAAALAALPPYLAHLFRAPAAAPPPEDGGSGGVAQLAAATDALRLQDEPAAAADEHAAGHAPPPHALPPLPPPPLPQQPPQQPQPPPQQPPQQQPPPPQQPPQQPQPPQPRQPPPGSQAALQVPAGAAPPAPPAPDPEALICVVCLEAQRAVVLLPCRHFVTCATCAATLPQPRLCPMCRVAVADVMPLFM